MNRDTSNAFKSLLFLVPILLALCFILSTCHEHYRQKWIAFAVDLKPRIDEARRSITAFHPTGVQSHSPRPYTIVYIGGTGTRNFAHRIYGGIINSEQFTDPPTPASIKTLILLEDEYLETQKYRITTTNKDTGNKLGSRSQDYQRHRYHLWAFDIANKLISASTDLQDEEFQATDVGHQISKGDLISWADSVTDSSEKPVTQSTK